MEIVSLVLGITAALLHGTAYFLYNVQTKLGQSNPNAASWSIWAFLSTLNALTFGASSGDFVATLQFYTGSVACILTFLYVLGIGKFAWPKRKDWGMFAIGLVATIVWWLSRSASAGNLIVLIAFVISFQPTLEGVWIDPINEKPLAWFLWSLALIATCTNVVILGKFGSLLTPFVLLLLHAAVAFLSRSRRREQFAARVPA